jgi:NAD(P)-dependent dehydrogenase (short-subunit alcohol dehydrogenase family)
MFRKKVNRIRGVSGSLEGSTILVADAAIGAGPGIVQVVAAAGASVRAAARDAAMLDVQLARLDSTPHPVTAGTIDTDLSDQMDALVINPDLGDPDTISPLLALASAAATGMKDRGHDGSIVFVTGIARTGPAGPAAAMLQAEMQSLAAACAANGIRVNAVAPGPVGANRRGSPLPSRATLLGQTTVHPVEVGKAVWFLLNAQLSSGITGTTLIIDRGASLLRPDW